ncbi:DMT family transporter [Thauera butanivorans]|uniref:DMT family transporter n=1 Tax=Thauera butanivorans TaxID=86174 RepID=UPI003AB44500
MPGGSQTTIGILCGAGAGALWGLVFLAPELVGDFSPLHLSFGRYLFYGLLSAALLAPRRHTVLPGLTRREWIGVGSLALVGNIAYYTLLSTAVQLGGIATTSLVIGFLPVAVTIIGSRDAGAVPLRKLGLSLVFCGAGALCISWQALAAPASGSTDRQIAGLLCALGALATWTWFAVANSRWLARLQRITAHDWNLLTGVVTGALTLGLLPFAALIEASSHTAADWLRLAGVAAGLAFFASIAGNALWNRMSRLLPLTLVGQMILFETLFALLYGFAWEKRLPTVLEISAFALVSLSVVSCVAAHRQPGDAAREHG